MVSKCDLFAVPERGWLSPKPLKFTISFHEDVQGQFSSTVYCTVLPNIALGKSKICRILIRQVVFADDVALLSDNQAGLQKLVHVIAD